MDVDNSLEVIGEADNGEAAIRQVEALQPDVVLMDIQMPVMNGVEATQKICQRFEKTKVLVLTVDDEDEYLTQALKYGAAGYLLKNTPPDELALAIQAVYKGYTHIGPGLGKKVFARIKILSSNPTPDWEELTPREQEILELIATGASNKEIAKTLHIAEKTVKNHVTSILQRLNLRDRTQAAIFAHSTRDSLMSVAKGSY
ncbi:response regulator transcription factor [Oscillatoria salina IIICB1]|nr:response regulator transcription factor [Oscillatoria salina IIICB1]